MKLLTKVKAMLFSNTKEPKPDALQAQVRIAVQRNESAGEKAREALEDFRASQLLLEVARRM